MLFVCISATGFYAYAVISARDLLARPKNQGTFAPEPPVSILKPLRGLDPNPVANFDSFSRQEYPAWEVLFGAEDESEPGLAAVRQVMRDRPGADIRIVLGRGRSGKNPKVRMLSRLAGEAKHPLLLISDSDIRAGSDHLRRMVEPLRDPAVGVVTCLYRTNASGFIGKIDALSLSTEFLPAVLVARRLEGMSFAMGAAILIRREVLDSIGGFAALEDGLADDSASARRAPGVTRVSFLPRERRPRSSTCSPREDRRSGGRSPE
jgi:ceramide glucosyltransferase